MASPPLHNRFYKVQLPQALSFFGGTRFVPIISTLVFALVGILMFFIWQPIQTGINALGMLVYSSGYFGTFLFGLIKRLLIPFGLHHVFYLPFWQTAVGGTMEVAGTMVSGAQNIFFAQLAIPPSPTSPPRAPGASPVSSCCISSASPELLWPCTAVPSRSGKKQVGGLLLSAALTSISPASPSPSEFSFLFVAPMLFGISAVFAGLAYMLCHMLNITVGLTFSGGLIDLALFGILQGNEKTGWLMILPLGAAFFAAYYFLFSFLIRRFDIKTPGREEGSQETKLYTKADYNAKKAEGQSSTAAAIAQGLGGADNIQDVDCCATRLRCTVKDAALVRQDVLKASGASGVICKGNGVQVVYGPKVAVIKAKLEDYLESAPKNPVVAPSPATAPAAKDTVLSACLNGTVVPLADVKDEAFASGVLGDGIAIEPSDGELVAPADGEISSTFETHHAVGMTTADGAELLMHIGIDTVKLGGKHFTYLVNEGDKVKKGQPLIRFELEAIKAEGYPVTTPVIVCNTDDYAAIEAKASGTVKQGDALLELKH